MEQIKQVMPRKQLIYAHPFSFWVYIDCRTHDQLYSQQSFCLFGYSWVKFRKLEKAPSNKLMKMFIDHIFPFIFIRLRMPRSFRSGKTRGGNAKDLRRKDVAKDFTFPKNYLVNYNWKVTWEAILREILLGKHIFRKSFSVRNLFFLFLICFKKWP